MTYTLGSIDREESFSEDDALQSDFLDPGLIIPSQPYQAI